MDTGKTIKVNHSLVSFTFKYEMDTCKYKMETGETVKAPRSLVSVTCEYEMDTRKYKMDTGETVKVPRSLVSLTRKYEIGIRKYKMNTCKKEIELSLEIYSRFFHQTSCWVSTPLPGLLLVES